MARKNPIGRLADNAISSLKDPRRTAEKVVEQAKGTAAFGKMVAEQVGRTAVSKATETAGAVVDRASARRSPRDVADAPRAEPPAPLRPVPDVNEAGHTPAENRTPGPLKKATDTPGRQGTPVEPAAEPTKRQGDPVTEATRKSSAKKVPSPADVAGVVEAAVAKDPNKTAATPVKKAPPAKMAAKKSAAKKAAAAPAKKTAPGDKLPVKKAADQAPAKKDTAKTPPVKKAADKAPAKKAAAKKPPPKPAE